MLSGEGEWSGRKVEISLNMDQHHDELADEARSVIYRLQENAQEWDGKARNYAANQRCTLQSTGRRKRIRSCVPRILHAASRLIPLMYHRQASLKYSMRTMIFLRGMSSLSAGKWKRDCMMQSLQDEVIENEQMALFVFKSCRIAYNRVYCRRAVFTAYGMEHFQSGCFL